MAEMYGMPVDAIKQALGSVDALAEDLKLVKL